MKPIKEPRRQILIPLGQKPTPKKQVEPLKSRSGDLLLSGDFVSIYSPSFGNGAIGKIIQLSKPGPYATALVQVTDLNEVKTSLEVGKRMQFPVKNLEKKKM